jgi:hypothetical protein
MYKKSDEMNIPKFVRTIYHPMPSNH